MKKLLLASLLLFSAHAFACGSDPTFGQFTCDTDSIRLTYGLPEMQNNKWINPSASPSDSFISGPPLNLEPGIGEFKSIQVTGSVKIFNSIVQQGHMPYSCTQVRHIFDVVLTAMDAANNPIILSSYPVSTTSMFSLGNNTGVCVLNGGQGPADLSFPFIFDFPAGKYQNFQIKIINLNLSGIDGVDEWVSYGIKNFNLLRNWTQGTYDTWYLQLVGIR